MLILDCSSRSQALLSLSSGFGCSVMELKKVLLSLDLEQIYETDHSIMIDSQQYLESTSVGNWVLRASSPPHTGFTVHALQLTILLTMVYFR
jgi:hypothetical protein